MSFRFPCRACGITVLLMTAANLPAQMPPPPGNLSPLAPPAVAAGSFTNAAPRVTRKDGLRYLEEELSRSLQFLSRKGSLDGLLAPPAPQPTPTAVIISGPAKPEDSGERRNGEDRERGRDLFNNSPNRDRTDRSNGSFEDVYDRLNRSRSGTLPGVGTDPLNPRTSRDQGNRSSSREDNQLSTTLREKERSLRERLSGSDSKEKIYNPGGQEGVFSGLFNRDNDGGLSREQIQTHQDYLDRYRQVLTISAPSVSALPELFKTQPGLGAQTPGLTTSGGLDTYSSPSRRDTSSSADINAVLRPSALPDLSARALNQWNPLYQSPRVEASKAAPATPPPFVEPPRRRF